jgi:hypothetical protein
MKVDLTNLTIPQRDRPYRRIQAPRAEDPSGANQILQYDARRGSDASEAGSDASDVTTL